MAQKTRPELPNDVREEMSAAVTEAARLARKARLIESRRSALATRLAHALKELTDSYDARIARLRERREEILSRVRELWDRHLKGEKSHPLDCGLAVRMQRHTLEVVDTRAVVDALDRLDRLDLLSEHVDEKGLLPFYKDGRLARLIGTAIRLHTEERFVLRADRKACDNKESLRILECACCDHADDCPGSGRPSSEAS